jgi:hypothetical protein
MPDLERIIGAAVAIEAETGEPVARRLTEAVTQFDGMFAPRRAGLSGSKSWKEQLPRCISTQTAQIEPATQSLERICGDVQRRNSAEVTRVSQDK